MNTQQLDQLLLLEQSGELSPKQRRQLDDELAASPEAKERRAALRGLAAAIPAPAGQAAPDAAARIDAQLRQAPKPAPVFHPVWKPALAAAAALALLFGVRAWRSAAPDSSAPVLAQVVVEEEFEWTDPLDADFTELEELLAAIDTDDSFEITEL